MKNSYSSKTLKIEAVKFTKDKNSAKEIIKFTKGIARLSKFGFLLLETDEGILVMRVGEYVYRIVGQKDFWYGSGKYIRTHFKK